MANVASSLVQVAYAIFALASATLAVVDVWKRRLPDAIVLPTLAIVGGLLSIAALLQLDWGRLVGVLGGALLLFAVYFALAAAHPRGLGAGDVKLAAVIGAALGCAGWGPLAVGALLGFALAGVGSILLLAVLAIRRGRGGSELPFGPFMLAGAWIGLLWGERLLASLGFA